MSAAVAVAKTPVTLVRLSDWPERLNDYLKASMVQTFAWGKHDCVLFAAGAVEAITGVDLVAGFRGKYKTELSAARVLRRYAGGGIFEAIEKALSGCEPVAPTCARRGDVVYLEYEGVGPTAAIIGLGGSVVAVSREGLIYLPTAAAMKAWRI